METSDSAKPIPGGPVDLEWITKAKPDIETRMANCDEGTGDFVLMSLVRDTLLDQNTALAENVKAIQATTTHLERSKPQGEEGVCVNGQSDDTMTNVVYGPDAAYNLTQSAIDQAFLPTLTQDFLRGDEALKIMTHRSKLIAAQTSIRVSIKEELECRRSDQEKAHGRRYDFGPLAFKLGQILARKRKGDRNGQPRKRQRQRG